MAVTIKIKGKFVTIKTGDTITLSRKGQIADLGKEGDIAEIINIHPHKHPGDSVLLISRADQHPRWRDIADLPGRGIDIHVRDAIIYFNFTPLRENMCVSDDFVFKGRNLKGLGCRFLATLQNGDYFVEFDEDIGGCSCDSLGRMGHCIVVGHDFLTGEEKKKNRKIREEN